MSGLNKKQNCLFSWFWVLTPTFENVTSHFLVSENCCVDFYYIHQICFKNIERQIPNSQIFGDIKDRNLQMIWLCQDSKLQIQSPNIFTPLLFQTIERIKKYCDICGGPATFIQVCRELLVTFILISLVLKHDNVLSKLIKKQDTWFWGKTFGILVEL